MYPQLLNENRKMSACKRLDFKTLGSSPVQVKFFPNSAVKRRRSEVEASALQESVECTPNG